MAIGNTNAIIGDSRKDLLLAGAQSVAWEMVGSGGTGFTWPSYLRLVTAETGGSEIFYVVANVIDLSSYSKLWISWEGTHASGSPGQWALAVSSTKNALLATYDARILRTSPFGGATGARESLDISALNGEYYIRVHVKPYSGSTITTEDILSVWLEV